MVGIGSAVSICGWVEIEAFTTAVRGYLAEGADFEYRPSFRTGRRASGRIDVVRTILHRARGHRTELAFAYPTISRATGKNVVLLAALREVENLALPSGLALPALVEARTVATMLEDCLTEAVTTPRTVHISNAVRIAQLPGERHRDLLELAAAILDRASLGDGEPSEKSVPRSWFLNIEPLFETAVRRAFTGALPGHDVDRGSRWGEAVVARPVVEVDDGDDADADPRRGANPDIVVAGRNEEFLLVGDAKYKTWNGKVKAGDLYQLLAHTAAFSCDRSAVFYPAEAYECVHLGASAVGSDVWLVAVDLLDIEGSVLAAISTMRLASS